MGRFSEGAKCLEGKFGIWVKKLGEIMWDAWWGLQNKTLCKTTMKDFRDIDGRRYLGLWWDKGK